MGKAQNFIDSDEFSLIIKDYIIYLPLKNVKYFSYSTKKKIVNEITIKLNLLSFTSKEILSKCIQELGYEINEKMEVKVKNEDPKKSEMGIYKEFCHEFLSLYLELTLNSYSSYKDKSKLLLLINKRVMKNSINNIIADLKTYLNKKINLDIFKKMYFKEA
tara:strand:- start:1449 stop:1931 length:483 start_codon:yes stop_codon:yes gene_type:complete